MTAFTDGEATHTNDARDECDGRMDCACAAHTAKRDHTALDRIAVLLRAPEWDSAADYVEAIAEIVSDTGRSLSHDIRCRGCGLGGWHDGTCSILGMVDDGVIRYCVKYENHDGDELVSHDAFTTLDDAMAHYRSVIAHPWTEELGGVYVTCVTDDEHVIDTHAFPAKVR